METENANRCMFDRQNAPEMFRTSSTPTHRVLSVGLQLLVVNGVPIVTALLRLGILESWIERTLITCFPCRYGTVGGVLNKPLGMPSPTGSSVSYRFPGDGQSLARKLPRAHDSSLQESYPIRTATACSVMGIMRGRGTNWI